MGQDSWGLDLVQAVQAIQLAVRSAVQEAGPLDGGSTGGDWLRHVLS